jgi:hypothetical protein
MRKQMTISYQYRGNRPTAPKLIIANHLLTKLSGFSIGDKVLVEYLKGQIIITKN